MTEKKRQLIAEMSRLLRDEEQHIFMPIADFLMELNYLPERRKVQDFSLAFKHGESKKIMARFDMRQVKKQVPFPLFSVKFFGVKDLPQRYAEALAREIEDGHYGGPPMSEDQKNRCGRCRDNCTGGGLGYYYRHPDGSEFLRCGAYPIPIYDLTADGVEEMKNVIEKQHEYFLSIS